MVNIVLTSSFTFQGNRTLTAFLSHVSIIKLIWFCPCAFYCSQCILSGYKFPVWFTVKFACFWLTFPAVLYSVKETVRLYCLSTPPPPPPRAKQLHIPPDDRVMEHPAQTALWPSNPAASPTPCIEYSERNKKRERMPGGGGGRWEWVVGWNV